MRKLSKVACFANIIESKNFLKKASQCFGIESGAEKDEHAIVPTIE